MPQGNTVNSADGVSIRYEVHGTSEPAIVLVHGWALDRNLWDGQVDGLSKRHRVITLDLAGHGESGANRNQWTISGLGRDVKAVVDAVGSKQVILVGHSMAGQVVLEAALLMPERVKGIILIDTLLDVEERSPSDEIDLAIKQLQSDYPTAAKQMSNEYLFSQNTPEPVRKLVLDHALALPPEISIALLRQAWSYDPLPALRQIKAPVLAINADKFSTNLDANRRHMPSYEVIILQGSGHYPMLEQPAEFNRALDDTINKISSGECSGI